MPAVDSLSNPSLTDIGFTDPAGKSDQEATKNAEIFFTDLRRKGLTEQHIAGALQEPDTANVEAQSSGNTTSDAIDFFRKRTIFTCTSR